MKDIIKETEEMSREYFYSLGFSDEQINPLIAIGMKDINNIIERIELLLEEDDFSFESLDNLLHGLKGLLYHMGNNTLADKINEMRSDESGSFIPKLKALIS